MCVFEFAEKLFISFRKRLIFMNLEKEVYKIPIMVKQIVIDKIMVATKKPVANLSMLAKGYPFHCCSMDRFIV